MQGGQFCAFFFFFLSPTNQIIELSWAPEVWCIGTVVPFGPSLTHSLTDERARTFFLLLEAECVYIILEPVETGSLPSSSSQLVLSVDLFPCISPVEKMSSISVTRGSPIRFTSALIYMIILTPAAGERYCSIEFSLNFFLFVSVKPTASDALKLCD